MDMNIENLATYGGLVGLAIVAFLYWRVRSESVGTDVMKNISDQIQDGAMAFLKRMYTILVIFVLVVFGLVAWKINMDTGLAFLAGAICSALAGIIGDRLS